MSKNANTLFNKAKSYVVAVDGKLPQLDASNLLNLPSFNLAWDNSTTYNQNDFVSYLDRLYVSKVSNNLNHVPSSDSQYWKDVSFRLNSLLFKVPIISIDEYYNLYVEFSTTDTFDNVVVYDTANYTSLFKAFTGTGLTSLSNMVATDNSGNNLTFPGLNYLFSGEFVQFDISNIGENYKYFRFHWTKDNGSTFGRFGYGNRETGVYSFSIDSDISISNVYGLQTLLDNKANSDDVVLKSFVKSTPSLNNKIITEADTVNNAVVAEKLSSSRSITLTGSITGSANYDSNGNISISTSLGSGFTIDSSNIEGLSIDWSDVQSKPNFVSVATTGLASDVTFTDSNNYFGGGSKTVLAALNNIGSSLNSKVNNTDKASKSAFGIVKIGDYLSVNNGVISVDAASLDTRYDSKYITSTSLSSTLNNYVLSSTLNNYVTSTSLSNTLNSYYTKSDIDNMDFGGGSVYVGGGLSGDGTEDNPLEINLYNFFQSDMLFGNNSGGTAYLWNNGIRLSHASRVAFNFDVWSGVEIGHGSQNLTLITSAISNLGLKIGNNAVAYANNANGLAVVGSDGKLPSSIIPTISVSYNDLTNKPTIPSKYSDLTNDTGKVLSDVNFSSSLNTKLTGIESGAEVNVIETINVNNTPLPVSNKSVNIDLTGKLDNPSGGSVGQYLRKTSNGVEWSTVQQSSGSSVESLLFKIPAIDDQFKTVHLKIQFSEGDTFSSVTEFNTSVSTVGFRVFTGLVMENYPSDGVTMQYEREVVKFDLSNVSSSLKYYRYQWIVTDNTDELNPVVSTSRYGFGQTTGLINIFD